jgi:hypothetical protein
VNPSSHVPTRPFYCLERSDSRLAVRQVRKGGRPEGGVGRTHLLGTRDLSHTENHERPMNGGRESGRTAADTAEGRNVEGGMSFRGGFCLGIATLGAVVWGGRTRRKRRLRGGAMSYHMDNFCVTCGFCTGEGYLMGCTIPFM